MAKTTAKTSFTISDAVVAIMIGSIVLIGNCLAFIASPKLTIRRYRFARQMTAIHQPQNIRSRVRIFSDYMMFDDLTIHTKIAIEDGTISGVIIDPVDPQLSDIYRSLQSH